MNFGNLLLFFKKSLVFLAFVFFYLSDPIAASPHDSYWAELARQIGHGEHEEVIKILSSFLKDL